MATDGFANGGGIEVQPPSPHEELAAGESQWRPLATAAIVGGAIAATAGAYYGTRALARRNGASEGKPVNSVMANAITACDVKPD